MKVRLIIETEDGKSLEVNEYYNQSIETTNFSDIENLVGEIKKDLLPSLERELLLTNQSCYMDKKTQVKRTS